MAEDTPSFEVRERRRFKNAASNEEQAEKTEDRPEKTDSPGEGATATIDGDADASQPTAKGPSPTPTEIQTDNSETASEAASEPGSETEDRNAQDSESDSNSGMPDLSVFGVLQFATGTLSQLAWQGMGLIANAATGKVEPRMAEARLAIDALAALAPVMNARLDDASKRELQTLLSNLRLNYVEQAKRREK